jgi:hypothetical protein
MGAEADRFRSRIHPIRLGALCRHRKPQRCDLRLPIHTRSCAGARSRNFRGQPVLRQSSGRVRLRAKHSLLAANCSNSIRERFPPLRVGRQAVWIPRTSRRELLQNVVQLRLIHHPSFEACLQAWQYSRKEPKWLAARLTSGVAERGWEPSGCDVHHCTVRQDRCHWSIGHNLDGTDCQDYRLELVTVRNGMSLIPDSHAVLQRHESAKLCFQTTHCVSHALCYQ